MKMFKVLLPALLLVNLFCKTAQAPVYWDHIEYMFQSGPVSPKYQYNYSVIINNHMDGIFEYTYGWENPVTLSYKFRVTKDKISAISKYISTMNLMGEQIPETPDAKKPIGGSLRNIKIVEEMQNPNEDRPPKVYETPYFPAEEYRADLNKMYDYIDSLVPKYMRDEAASKREAYLNGD